jgi:heptosyltransferase-1
MVGMAWPPYRIGCFGLKEFSYLFSKSLPGGQDLHAVDRNLEVAEFLGAGKTDPEFVLGLTKEEQTWAEEFFRGKGIPEERLLLGLQVGASLPQKCWPLRKMVALTEAISTFPKVQLVLLGDQTDREKLKPYLSRIPQQVINTTGDLSLRQLIALISQCHLFIGADTGPLHLAVGLGKPVIALCGADDPKWTGPYGPSNQILYKKFACSPCNKKPICQGRYDCMEAIEVEEVIESLNSVPLFSRT